MRERLRDKRVIVCAGAGGVGKTTTSAALALGLAADGARVAVVTIDPARRLANALGLGTLENDPRRVDRRRLAGHGLDVSGELWAMTLDSKRTFDELIDHLAPDEGTAREVLANRIYQQISTAVAGSQEYTAMAKLYELDRDGRFDAIVLDTPPSRNALDFLDAPERLTAFLEGRALRMLLAPTGLAARVVGRGASVGLRGLRRVTGVELLEDLSTFFGSLGRLLDGFRERAAGVQRLLADPATTFIVVASPEREPVEEAIYFGAKLSEAGLPFGGLVVNRVHAPVTGELDTSGLGPELATKVSEAAAEVAMLAERDAAAVARLRTALGDDDPVLVPHLSGDVHDVDGLVAMYRHLWGVALDRHALHGKLLGLAEQLVGQAADVGVQVPAEDVAQDRAQVAGKLVDDFFDAGVGRAVPGDHRALQRDGLSHALGHDRARLRLGAQRRHALGEHVGGGLGGKQRTQREQVVGEPVVRRALAAHLEARQRPGQLAAARHPPPDEVAERAQLVLLAGLEDEGPVRVPARAGGHGLPRPAGGANPCRRAHGHAGLVVEAQRRHQPAHARGRLGDNALVVAAHQCEDGLRRAFPGGGLRHALDLAGRNQCQPGAERELGGLDLEPEQRDDDLDVADAGVHPLCELTVGPHEAFVGQRELRQVLEEVLQEGAQRDLGALACARGHMRVTARAQVGVDAAGRRHGANGRVPVLEAG